MDLFGLITSLIGFHPSSLLLKLSLPLSEFLSKVNNDNAKVFMLNVTCQKKKLTNADLLKLKVYLNLQLNWL